MENQSLKKYQFWRFRFYPSRTMPSFAYCDAAIVFYRRPQSSYYFSPFPATKKHGSAQVWKIQFFW